MSENTTWIFHDTEPIYLQLANQLSEKILAGYFHSDQLKQMELVTDFEWIPFEKLKDVTGDLHEVFKQSDYMDEQRIEVICNGVTERFKQLQEMEMEQKHQISFTNL